MRKKRRLFVVIVFIAASILIAQKQVMAQSGACPPNSYLLGNPADSWQSSTKACTYNQLVVSLLDDTLDFYPCQQWVNVLVWNVGQVIQDSVVYVPPAAQFLSQTARVRFHLWFIPVNPFQNLIPPGPEYDTLPVKIEYYSSNGNLMSFSVHPLGDYTKISTWWDDGAGINHYYNVYIIDQTLYTDNGAGGFFKVRLLTTEDNRPPNGYSWAMSSWRAGAQGDYMPELCSIPNASLPGPTPHPTGTIPPTWTPNATPSPTPIQTPGATSIGTTPVPTWTPTAWVWPTLQAEITPSPWPHMSIPTVQFSTPGIPVVDPVTGSAPAIPTPDPVSIGSLASGIELVVTRWFTSTNYGLGLGEVLPIQQAYTSGITSTYIISGAIAPTRTIIAANAGTVGGVLVGIPVYIGEAVGYWKMLGQLLPSFWPLLSGIIIYFFVVVFILLLRFGVHTAIALSEWLRRIIELIPGM